MPHNKNVKDLKQILEDHNCAIPQGSKKKDLIDLVEAIMAKDEDFVTMQTANPEEMFDEMFDQEQEQDQEEEKEEEQEQKQVVIRERIGTENKPSMFGDEWNEFAMSHFYSNELIDGNPICAGLRRVAELLLGDIVESGPEQVFPATDGLAPDRATVVFKVVFNWMNSGEYRIFREVADVWHGNTDDLFCAHPAATASTRAEGRALRKALKLRCLAAEELAKKDIVGIVQDSIRRTPTSGEYEADQKISTQQVQFIDTKCNQLDIDVLSFINMGSGNYHSIVDVTKDSAKKMIKVLNGYQNDDGLIQDTIKGYKTNWRL